MHFSHPKLCKSVWAKKSSRNIHGFCNHPPVRWGCPNFYLEPWHHRLNLLPHTCTLVFECPTKLNLNMSILNSSSFPSTYSLCLSCMCSVTSARSLAVSRGWGFSSSSTRSQFPRAPISFFLQVEQGSPVLEPQSTATYTGGPLIASWLSSNNLSCNKLFFQLHSSI